MLKVKLKIALVYTTVATERDAELVAFRALEEAYAACVNIIPCIKSIYTWQGKIEQSTEWGILFKTTQAKLAKLQVFLRQNHPYELPAILQWNVSTTDVFYDYLQSANKL